MTDDLSPAERAPADGSIEGYREHEHTADWELGVWAPDLPRLLEQAARGMYALAGMRLNLGPRTEWNLQLSAPDAESLLVGFLQELLYQAEMDSIGFDRFDLRLVDYTLDATMSGARISSISKEIKAVTYHNLEIRSTERGLAARIVFDV